MLHLRQYGFSPLSADVFLLQDMTGFRTGSDKVMKIAFYRAI
jgi:hypothetical protein